MTAFGRLQPFDLLDFKKFEGPLLIAISTGRRNTLLETHNIALILLNQRNSSSFMRAQSADRREAW